MLSQIEEQQRSLGNMTLALSPGPAAGMVPPPPITVHIRVRSVQRVVGEVGESVGGGKILAMGKKTRTLPLDL